MRRRPAILLRVFLLLIVGGAIVNVSVAWACAMWSQVAVGPSAGASGEERLLFTKCWQSDLSATLSDPDAEPMPLERVVMYARRDGGFGYQVCTLSRVTMFPTARLSWGEEAMATVRAGWPRAAMAGRRWDAIHGWDQYVPEALIGPPPPSKAPATYQTGVLALTRPESLGGRSQRLFPWRPEWPGFAINTLFSAAILWLLFIAPFALRRHRRIARGVCPKCAYPMGDNPVCTECGSPLPSRPRAGIGALR